MSRLANFAITLLQLWAALAGISDTPYARAYYFAAGAMVWLGLVLHALMFITQPETMARLLQRYPPMEMLLMVTLDVSILACFVVGGHPLTAAAAGVTLVLYTTSYLRPLRENP